MIKKIKILFIVCSAQQIFFFLFKNLYLFAIKVPNMLNKVSNFYFLRTRYYLNNIVT